VFFSHSVRIVGYLEVTFFADRRRRDRVRRRRENEAAGRRTLRVGEEAQQAR